jgi:Acetyltransferase (GNAT) domain
MTMPSPAVPRLGEVRIHFRIGELTVASAKRMLACQSFEPAVARDAIPSRYLPFAASDGWLLEGVPAIDGHWPDIEGSWIVYPKAKYERHFADLSKGYEAYLNKFSGKTRSTLKRKLRKFEEASGGNIHWRCYRSPSDAGEFYRLARGLSEKTYQERLLGSGLPKGEAFERDLANRAAKNAFRGYILFLEKKPVSYLYLPLEGSRAVYHSLGYDPEFSALSPGTVLQLLAMEDLCADQRIKIFDFTQGGGEHKRLFGTFSVECLDLLLLRRTFRNVVLVATHSLCRSVDSGVGVALDRFGIKRRLKQWIRAHA